MTETEAGSKLICERGIANGSEFEDHIDSSTGNDIIRISGASEQSIYKLTITYNGSVDITITCLGTGNGRLTE